MNMDTVNRLKHRINELLCQKNRVVVGIDGQCAAGKTTLAEALSHKYDCNVLHMDDFFLRPEQRTKERYDELGGNVDYERFHDEVILPLLSGGGFSYRPYDCHTQKLKEAVYVKPKALNIIEGTYALHPYNAFAFDFSVCLRIDGDLQRKRLLARAPEQYREFLDLWIPMENKYLTERLGGFSFDEVIWSRGAQARCSAFRLTAF